MRFEKEGDEMRGKVEQERKRKEKMEREKEIRDACQETMVHLLFSY